MLNSVNDWLDEVSEIETTYWYIKRLSGNDTLANGSHQAGPYIPRDYVFELFPAIKSMTADNAKEWFDLYIDSHGDQKNICVTWYNNKLRGGTRNEARFTNFGGADSPLLDPESTGSIAVFVFVPTNDGSRVERCHVWISRHELEEDAIEERVGSVEPGLLRFFRYSKDTEYLSGKRFTESPCWLTPEQLPATWLEKFPSGLEIIQKVAELRPDKGAAPDERLMRRRKCEYELYQSLEEAVELPTILRGFGSIEEFIKKAQTILQRRRSRAGNSLEYHAMQIFEEERLREGFDFSHQPVTELSKKPDFLFPAVSKYLDPSFPEAKLRMLAVKTTCKDRWRQILNEADRIPQKHLLTLQEGVSEKQFMEMQHEGVQLVVPEPVMSKYSERIRPHLTTLESFIADVRLLNL